MTTESTVLTTLALYTTIMVVAITLCTTIVGGIAFWKTQQGAARTFSLLLERAHALQLLAVILIIVAAVALRMTNGINSEAVVSILSGIAGYVLGGVSAERRKEDSDGSK
jgi:hypothetical protein